MRAVRASENTLAAVTICTMFVNKSFLTLWAATIVFMCAACIPNFNWREVHGTDPSYTVLLPSKPSSHTRDISLDGQKLTMSMTAAETDDINFAVASAKIDNAAQRNAALLAMQKAMLQNIRGEMTQQKNIALKDGTVMTEIHATGMTSTGRKLSLFARFGTREEYVFQVIALGPPEKLTNEIADTFLSSFSAH